jgi:hypothetical protein
MSGGGNIEFWRNEKLLKKVPANKFYNYQYFMQYHDSVSIRVRGLVYFDDYVRSDGFYDTFEEGVKGEGHLQGSSLCEPETIQCFVRVSQSDR